MKLEGVNFEINLTITRMLKKNVNLKQIVSQCPLVFEEF